MCAAEKWWLRQTGGRLEDGGGGGGGNVQKVVQAVVITDTSSVVPQQTGPHCMWATGCDKAAQESKVTFFKHKFSGHTVPIRMGQTGNLNNPLHPTPAQWRRGGG